MTDDPAESAAPPNRRMRRREAKDTLLADEPPRALGISIVTVAVLLGTAVFLAWSMSYQTKIDVMVALEPAGGGALDGRALLPADQIARVQEDQRVTLDYPSSNRDSRIVGRVTGVAPDTTTGLYQVHIEFPPGPDAIDNGINAALKHARSSGGQIPATIFTQKVKVFARVFEVFRGLSQR
ncbi:MAG TPA: hypothetical protein VI756_13075 [Blastocatellia bacterium]